MILTISTGTIFCQPVAAANIDVNSNMTNDQIQDIIDNVGVGDTITFLAGIYSNVKLSISTAVNLVSDEATLNSDGSSTIFTITGSDTAGTNITGFFINGNGMNIGISATNTYGINIIDNIFNNTYNAVSLSNVSESSISDNEINNNTDYAIDITDSGNLTSRNNVVIDGNTMINTNGGIYLVGSGFTITNNYLDMNYGDENGISGNNVYSTLIQGNTLVNGDDGINIYMLYKNLTINNNTIINMTGGYGDAISLANHNTNKETDTYTTITNNILDNNNYGIFIGGNFQGSIVNNSINNSLIAGMSSVGKKSATSGSLNANITGNNITNAGDLGISMENPNVLYLNLSDNNIESAGYSIQYNQYYRNNGDVILSGNTFSNPQNWIVSSSMTNDYIQSIIDGANTGDSITFLSGTYNDMALTISNALNLIGNGAILNNNGSSTIFTITGSNSAGTNITSFFINGSGTNNGINVVDTANINIADNIFNNTYNAVSLSNVSESSISDNEINNNTDNAIDIADNGDLDNVVIDGNTMINTDGGIYLVGSGFTITNNYIDMNGSTGNGISGSNVYSVLIENNTLLNGDDGINIYKSYKNFTVNNNTILNMGRDGISFVNHNAASIETDTSTVITNNYVQGNEYGLFIGGNFQGNVTNNVFDDSSLMGMQIKGKQQATQGILNANITGNNITNADDLGISMEHPDVEYLNLSANIIDSDGFSIQYNQYYRNNGDVILSGNTFSNPQNWIVTSTMTNDYIQSIIDGANTGDSITFLTGTYNDMALTISNALNLIGNGAILNNNGTSSTLTVNGPAASGTNITGFTISGAGENGISINNTDNVTISNNNITGNSVGVGINNSQDNTITNNNISDNTNNGVDVSDDSTSNDISDNTISGNGGNGVSLNGSDNNTVSSNTISDNGGNGVDVDSSSGNEITDNSISGNDENGVYLDSSDSNTVSNNNIYENTERGIYQVNSANNTVSNNKVHDNGINLNVTSVDPAYGAVINNPNKTITLTFSEAIEEGTGWIEFVNGNWEAIGFSYSIDGNTLTITPDEALVDGSYCVYLHTGSVTDLSGNPLNLYKSYFKLDTVSPTVVSTSPTNGATSVNPAKTITVTFSEAIRKSSNFWVELVNLTTGEDVDYTSYITGGNMLVISPVDDLAEVTYKVILHTGCVTDLAGNPLAVTSFRFTVGAAPTVTATSPVDGATNVNVAKTITVTFSEAIRKSSNFWVELVNFTTGEAVAYTSYITSGNILVINPTDDLAANTTYKVILHTGCVTDLAGNPLRLKSFSFTTR